MLQGLTKIEDRSSREQGIQHRKEGRRNPRMMLKRGSQIGQGVRPSPPVPPAAGGQGAHRDTQPPDFSLSGDELAGLGGTGGRGAQDTFSNARVTPEPSRMKKEAGGLAEPCAEDCCFPRVGSLTGLLPFGGGGFRCHRCSQRRGPAGSAGSAGSVKAFGTHPGTS